MARPKGNQEARSTWFRTYYQEDQTRLDLRNAEVRDAWQEAHPNESWTSKHAQTMANVKTDENRKLGRKPRGKGGRKKRMMNKGENVSPSVGMPVEQTRTRNSHTAPPGTLENLELAIDEIYVEARTLAKENADMENIVRHLRFARNGVVLLRGER